MTKPELGRVLVPVAPPEEQRRIAQAIDERLTHLHAVISHIRVQVELLQEYHTCLIADVVTGKLDVREAAAELPEVDPLVEDDLDSTIHDRENSNLGELNAEKSAAEYTIAKEVTV